jgi:hypothetical protein
LRALEENVAISDYLLDNDGNNVDIDRIEGLLRPPGVNVTVPA